MQISKGVEWAAHAAALMCGLPPRTGLRAEALARYHGVPKAYMAKQMQALSKAGLVHTARGKNGGYRLARSADAITLWDVMRAIEGDRPAFICTEIRQNGPCGATPDQCRQKCAIAAAFHAAEAAFRDHLQSVSLVDIAAGVLADSPPDHLRDVGRWLGEEAVALG